MKLLPIPALTDNYIWLLADERYAIVVDPGESTRVEKILYQENLELTAILLTHHHADHIAGAMPLAQRFHVPIYAPDDQRILSATHYVYDGDRLVFDLPKIEFEVIAIPGHTLSHIAFYGNKFLFCGDALFSLGCGRLFEGTPIQMLSSLDRLCQLPSDTLVCCGHEYTLANGAFALTVEPKNPNLRARIAEAQLARASLHPTLPSTLSSEAATNPFLRLDSKEVCQSLATELGDAIDDRTARFALLRRRKDYFRETIA